MIAYKNFALLYDKLMQDAPYDDWLQFTKDIVQNQEVTKLVDLGCGTGELTLRLAQDNLDIYGVDLSADMLAIAEQKALHQRVDVTWIKQDIRTLQGFTNVDLVISYCDVINYIVEKSDVKKVFANVYDSLSRDGLFIFDVHSMHHVRENLTNETFAFTDDSLAYIWDCFPGEIAGEMYHEMTFFYEDEATGSYKRIDESHHQRTYKVNTYVDLLREVQFQNINVYADFSIENEFCEQKSERIFIVAKK